MATPLCDALAQTDDMRAAQTLAIMPSAVTAKKLLQSGVVNAHFDFVLMDASFVCSCKKWTTSIWLVKLE